MSDNDVFDPKETGLYIETSAETCACGCGEKVRTKRTGAPATRFRQGHDQRLVGLLARTAADTDTVHVNDGATLLTSDALTYAQTVMSPNGVAKVRAAIGRATSPRPAAKARRTHADQAFGGDVVRIRVGRWEYEATREGDAFHYKNAQGEGRAVHVSKAKVV